MTCDSASLTSEGYRGTRALRLIPPGKHRHRTGEVACSADPVGPSIWRIATIGSAHRVPASTRPGRYRPLHPVASKADPIARNRTGIRTGSKRDGTVRSLRVERRSEG